MCMNLLKIITERWDDETGRPETMCTRTNVLGPLVPKLIIPCDTMLIHPCHFALYNTFRLGQNDRDVSMKGHCVHGTIYLGDQGSQNIRTGTHGFGTSGHPTRILGKSTAWDLLHWQSSFAMDAYVFLILLIPLWKSHSLNTKNNHIYLYSVVGMNRRNFRFWAS